MIPDLHTFVAIDPGFAKGNGTGWCLVVARQIYQLSLATATDHRASLATRAKQIAACIPASFRATGFTEPIPLPRVIEHMRIYSGPQQKGDQNDLLDLAYLEGKLDEGDVRLVPARTWKGNVPKDIMQTRIEKKLLALGVDLSGLPRAKEKKGSVLEAAGIALWVMGAL